MKKVLIAGCGGAPSEGVVNSLLLCNKGDEIIGMGSEPADLIMSNAKKKFLIPYAIEDNYETELIKILHAENPDLVHFQNDIEIFKASIIRDEILKTGTKLFMPPHETIDVCVNKYKSYLKWKKSGIKVPENIYINSEDDLKLAFSELSDKNGNIWLRSASISGGGKGALPTNDYNFAKGWIDRYKGWGEFIAAKLLSPDSVTWLSIWHEGELIVAQTRKRIGWIHGNRTLSGITGVTKVGQTMSDNKITEIAIDSIKCIDSKPHGIFGVDLTLDFDGYPNPTEINISRFFTTILFFTKAGLNMPKIYKDIILHNEFPKLKSKINPLPNNLYWLRAMDSEPMLKSDNDFKNKIIKL